MRVSVSFGGYLRCRLHPFMFVSYLVCTESSLATPTLLHDHDLINGQIFGYDDLVLVL